MPEREKINDNSKIRHKIVKIITTENKGGKREHDVKNYSTKKNDLHRGLRLKRISA